MTTQYPNLDQILERGYRYALALSHNEAEAEDLVQEACVRIIRSSKPLNIGYFFTTIRNYFIEISRHKNKFQMLPLEYIPETEIPTEDSLRKSEKTIADAELLTKALSALSPWEREILYLFIIEEYTAKEIGEIVEKPRNTILSIIHRARKKLREILEDEYAEVSL